MLGEVRPPEPRVEPCNVVGVHHRGHGHGVCDAPRECCLPARTPTVDARGHVRGMRIDEALFVPSGGYRSTLGTLKHIAGWSHVYRSYAFEAEPRHWEHIDWPRGLRDTVEPSQSYLDEVIAWAQAAHTSWLRWLDELPDDAALDSPRPMHWGELKPL